MNYKIGEPHYATPRSDINTEYSWAIKKSRPSPKGERIIMGRKKINKPRRPRHDWAALQQYVDAYICGHCHSRASAARGPDGHGRALIRHDDTCPVLAGALADLPDTLRAAEATHGMVVAVGDRHHFTVHGTPEEKAAVVEAVRLSGRWPG
ncbi:hypothetical protein AB0C70_23025 [Streptomyces sp. NPDC048564]|uniref:hypothetical protein n=1 Tax=Streptomyces sp. NPDC048564 TaxID=3155760 RepID=UPI00342336F4